jgi:hypothetical protein
VKSKKAFKELRICNSPIYGLGIAYDRPLVSMGNDLGDFMLYDFAA